MKFKELRRAKEVKYIFYKILSKKTLSRLQKKAFRGDVRLALGKHGAQENTKPAALTGLDKD